MLKFEAPISRAYFLASDSKAGATRKTVGTPSFSISTASRAVPVVQAPQSPKNRMIPSLSLAGSSKARFLFSKGR